MTVSERYSLENIAKSYGMSIEDFKLEMDKQQQIKDDMINQQLSKGLTYEQAETHVLRCLYIAGFSGPTFTN